MLLMLNNLADGRKSMGFYIGYALSLFGRRQDRMSHILVEETFETHPEFFYPPKKPHFLNTRPYGMADASKAQVMLAEIPFVRMRKRCEDWALVRIGRFLKRFPGLRKCWTMWMWKLMRQMVFYISVR